HGRHSAQPLERQGVHYYQDVIVGLFQIVLTRDRRAEEHHRAKSAPVGELELPYPFFEFHHRPHPPLPARATTASSESSTAPKPAEATTTPSASAPTATPPAAPASATEPSGGNDEGKWHASWATPSPSV